MFYPNPLNDSDFITINANGGSAILISGTKTAHVTSIFMPHIQPFMTDKDSKLHLKFNKNENKFELFKNNKKTNMKYEWNEIRASIAARMWCFENQTMADKFNPYFYDNHNFTLNDILNVLKNDLISKNRITQSEINKLKPYDLGILLMSEYINYPISNFKNGVYISYNYCLIFKLLPQKLHFLFAFIEHYFCA